MKKKGWTYRNSNKNGNALRIRMVTEKEVSVSIALPRNESFWVFG